MVVVLGLTGPIGCGKSTVASLLRDLGALVVIDADAVVHGLMGPNSSLSNAIAREFGSDVLREDGAVNRAKLAAIVFADAKRLRKLEELVDPEVRGSIQETVDRHARAKHQGVIAIEAIRLLTSPLRGLCSEIWLVTCDRARQIERLTTARGYSADEADARIASSPDFADAGTVTVIENSGDRETLRLTVSGALAALSPNPV